LYVQPEMATNSGWILDPERNDYYIIYYNAYGMLDH
jgi:hypothetical protein